MKASLFACFIHLCTVNFILLQFHKILHYNEEYKNLTGLLCVIFSFDALVLRTVHMQEDSRTADESYINICRVPRVIARWVPWTFNALFHNFLAIRPKLAATVVCRSQFIRLGKNTRICRYKEPILRIAWYKTLKQYEIWK